MRDLTAPPQHWEQVTLSDTVDITMGVCSSFIPDQDCDLKVTCESGAEVTLQSLKAGVQYWGRFRRFWSTGTTASTVILAGK